MSSCHEQSIREFGVALGSLGGILVRRIVQYETR
jgi:hypothetical protein